MTDENKQDFITRYIQWLFIISVKEPLKSLEEGYKKIINE